MRYTSIKHRAAHFSNLHAHTAVKYFRCTSITDSPHVPPYTRYIPPVISFSYPVTYPFYICYKFIAPLQQVRTPSTSIFHPIRTSASSVTDVRCTYFSSATSTAHLTHEIHKIGSTRLSCTSFTKHVPLPSHTRLPYLTCSTLVSSPPPDLCLQPASRSDKHARHTNFTHSRFKPLTHLLRACGASVTRQILTRITHTLAKYPPPTRHASRHIHINKFFQAHPSHRWKVFFAYPLHISRCCTLLLKQKVLLFF